MLAKVYGGAVFGIDATTITVEVNIDRGIGYHLVGLPDSAIKESNYRIAAALLNNGFKIPGKKITINMAPADLRKEGSAYDLPLKNPSAKRKYWKSLSKNHLSASMPALAAM